MAGMMFSTSLGEKCVFVLFMGNGIVTELGFHLLMRWYVLLFMCSILVMLIGLGRVYVGFLDCLGVRGYVSSLYVVIVLGIWCMLGVLRWYLYVLSFFGFFFLDCWWPSFHK